MLLSWPTVLVLPLALFFAAPALAGEGPMAAFADSDIFAPRLDLTIWTIVVFVVLLLVLKKFAWGPMLQGLQNREAAIRGALDEAQSARDEAHQLRTQLQAEMEKMNEKMREALDEA